MTPTPCIFGVGTGRSGGWLATNIMSVHSRVMAFNERVHFFRFYYKKYDPLTPRNVERMIRHLCLRLDARFGLQLAPDPMIDSVFANPSITYKSCYVAIMRYLSNLAGREIWVEYAPMTWRSVPVFMGMFPDEGRAFHIYRDPRGVLASWKRMSFMPSNLYLNQIFNWIDSINHLLRFREMYSRERFLPLRFEDIHLHPEETVNAICELMGITVEPQQLMPERWPDLFDERFVEANVSAHDGKRYYGFNPKLIDNWKNVLNPWEVALTDLLARPQMEAMGYEPTETGRFDDIRKGLEIIRNEPFLLRNLQNLLSTGEGTQDLPNDPTKPENWGAADGFSKFIDTPHYDRYVRDIEAIESFVRKKYECLV